MTGSRLIPDAPTGQGGEPSATDAPPPVASPSAASAVQPSESFPYDKAERVADAAVHCVGVALALMAAPVMIVLAALLDGSGPVVAGVSVYGAGMLLMLGCSAAYHLVPVLAWREILRRLDHAAIYVKIAATQTPFAVMIGGAGAGWLLSGLWTAALGGAAARVFWPRAFRPFALPLYLALGWAGVALFWPGQGGQPLSLAAIVLIVIGGLVYTAGVLFFLAEKLRFHNAIWHGFVLVATFVFYSAVVAEIGLRAAG